jgi:hypothetical protein
MQKLKFPAFFPKHHNESIYYLQFIPFLLKLDLHWEIQQQITTGGSR